MFLRAQIGRQIAADRAAVHSAVSEDAVYPSWYNPSTDSVDAEGHLSASQQQEIVAQLETDIQRAETDIKARGAIECFTCKTSVGFLNSLASSHIISRDFVVRVGTEICSRLKLQTPEVCEQIVPLFGPWLLSVLASSKFKVDQFCGAVDFCRDVQPLFQPAFPQPKPPRRRRQPHTPYPGKQILHLSDWHYDPEYQVGLEAECEAPICCRSPEHGGAKLSRTVPIQRPAGKFGDYRCDTPHRLAKEVLKHAMTAGAKNPNFVIMTGDLPPHDVWLSTEQSVSQAEQQVADDLQEVFTPRNTTVYMTLGNHDSYVPNSFPPTNFPGSDARVLYQALAKQWSQWLPPASELTMSQFGYYSAVRPEDNLRVISLNTNFAYLLNWWIFVADADPENMFQWLINELDEAERLQQDVYIIGHVPPGNFDVSRLWSDTFYKIAARYEDTIVAQFYGHTHRDEFRVNYDDDQRSNPVGVAYLAPSITTYPFLNPGYRVYVVDRVSNVVRNHLTWVMDLPKSNELGAALWNMEYDALSFYNMTDLSPASWHDLTVRMEQELIATRETGSTDTPLLNRFLKFRYKSTPLPQNGDCDRECKKKVVCLLRSAKSFFPCPDIDSAATAADGRSSVATITAWQDKVSAC